MVSCGLIFQPSPPAKQRPLYKRQITELLAVVFVLVSAAHCAVAAPSVTQLAAQLYPKHALLQLSPKTTSGLQAAIQQPSSGSPDAAAPIMVVLTNGASNTLVVDKALKVESGQSFVLTTPAALEAAAAGDAAAALSPADLLVVQCRGSKSGSFILASEFSSLELLGLSVQGCSAPAVTANYGGKLKLFNTHLLGNKADEEGGALLLRDVQQVELQHVTCNRNYAAYNGGCLNAYRGGEIIATDSVFSSNLRSTEATGGLLDGGAAIFAELLGKLTVTRCKFSNNAALYGNGGAIFCSNCEGVTITASDFTNNSAVDTGGAVFAGEVGLVTITDTNFTKNGPLPKAADVPAAANGGAVGLQGTRTGNKYPVNLIMRYCRFTSNEADVGGAVYGAQYNAGKGRMEIHGSMFVGNKGVIEGGAVYMEENLYSELIVNASVFEGNAGGYGGAVDAYDSDVLVADCTFTGNEATDSDGGAIQAYTSIGVGSGNKLAVLRSTFTENFASEGGGAILADGQAVEIQDVAFTANEARIGGAVSVANAPTVSISSSTFENNTAEARGGGLRVNSAAQATLQDVKLTGNTGLDGGGIYMALVSSAAFTNLNLTSNTARISGGGVAIIGPSNVTWTTGKVLGNTASLGAGVAADSNTLNMESVDFADNVAQPLPEEEKGSKRRKLQQATSAAPLLNQFASQVYSRETGGAVLVQQSALHLSGCKLSGNRANGDAGAVLVQQPTGLTLTDTSFDGNVAQGGTGAALLVIGAGPPVSADLNNCSFADNRAASGSGGAIVLNSGLGRLNVTCEGCMFERNSAGQDGGAVAASGPTSFACANCQSADNTAAFNGGWISCRGCSQASITSGSSSNNSAGAAGGAVSCAGCGSLTTSEHAYSSNSAGAGGAVSVQTAQEVGMRGCTFDSNTADRHRVGAGSSAQLQRMSELPHSWQGIYGLGAAAAGVDCTGRGSGGGLCVDEVASASIADNSLTNNNGSTGGAMFASAGCGDESMNCTVQVSSLRATGNKAMEAGGVLYTTTPHEVHLSEGSGSAIDQLRQQQLIQQLEQDNQVAAGGYGAAMASFPSELSLMAPQNELATEPTAAAAEQRPGRQRRKLQQLDRLSAARNDIIDTVTDAFQFTSSAAAGYEDQLDPVCPLLGASVLSNQVVGVDSNQIFSLPVYVLDAFTAAVKSGPGSDWVIALQDKSTGNIGQLSGASRARLQAGHAVLSGMSLQAEPGSNVTLLLTAIPPLGVREQPLSTELTVQVRPCLAGQEAVFSNSSSTGAAISMFCRTCAAPTFSFTAYEAGKSGVVCNTCPARAYCVAGVLIPQQGAFQFHPRSAYIQQCPNTKACLRSMDAMQNLQGLQCAYRRYNNSEAIDPRPYTALQCSNGYAGPYCSGCYRPGRNAWLALQMQRSAQRNHAGSGFTFADEVVLVRPHTSFDEGQVYGKSNGRCTRCPHVALAWIGFILARGLDMLFVAALALLWLGFGWLSQSAAAAALRDLKKERLSELNMRSTVFGSELMTVMSTRSSGSVVPLIHSGTTAGQGNLAAANSVTSCSSVRAGKGPSSPGANGANAGAQGHCTTTSPFAANALGPSFSGPNPPLQPEGSVAALLGRRAGSRPGSGLYNIYHAPSMHWESAVNMLNMLQLHQTSKDYITEHMLMETAAVLLLCVKHLACLVQTVLDGAQVAAVLLSLDLLFFVPDWVASAMSAVLMTQANTWQWVPFDCLLPAGSPASAAVMQTGFALIMPVVYVLVLYPLLLSILDMKENNPASFYRTCVQSKAIAGPGSRQAGNMSKWSKFWPANGGTWSLLTALAVASMAYSYAFYVANVTAAFNCMALGSRPSVPGEVGISGSVWVPDMQLACGSGPHVAALLLALVVGIPLLVGYWLLLLTLSWPADASAADMAGPPVTASGRWSFLPRLWHLFKSALLLPARLLEPGVRACQQATSRAGLSGESCAGLGVWNAEWRWWWLCGREMVKLVVIVVATVTSMRGPDMQGRVMLFFIVLAAGVSWRVQAGCSTSMDQLQYVMWCWLQLLALLVLVPSLHGVSATGYGAFLFALLALVLLQVALLLGCFVYRALVTCRAMGAGAADGAADHDVYDEGPPAATQLAGSGMPVGAVTSWKNPQGAV